MYAGFVAQLTAAIQLDYAIPRASRGVLANQFSSETDERAARSDVDVYVNGVKMT